MRSTARFDSALNRISRKFVYHQSGDTENGYSSIAELCTDVGEARAGLATLDSEPAHAHTEYWIRLVNDFTSYCEDWPLDIQDERALHACVETFNGFESPLAHRSHAFTQTQQTRLLSIALRARQATLEPVFTNLIDSVGSTMTL